MKILIPVLIILVFIISACTPYQLNKTTRELEESNQRIQNQQEELDSLRQEVEDLKPDSEEQTPGTIIDLTQWREDEIIQALATKNTKFKDAEWFNYEYRDDKAYYDIVGKIFPVDPFYDITYSKRNRQLKVNNLRLFNLDPGNKEIGDEEYQKYENKINRKMLLNSELQCTFHRECRGTSLWVCNTLGSQLHSWFSYPYLFITRDDNGETLNTFKEFYC